MSHQFVFVVDDSRFQAQAMLLAASLHRFSRDSSTFVAYAPASRIPEVSPLLHSVFKATGTELRSFEVRPRMWRKPYPHGNKIIACAAAEASAGPEIKRITFLDTDTICRADMVSSLMVDERVRLVPEGKPTWGKSPKDWQRAYDFFDLPLPQERVKLVRGRKIESLPYFNAGLVSFPTTVKGTSGMGFAEAWADAAAQFDRCSVANKRPWLDQITLPLTLYRDGFRWAALKDRYNYSLAEREKKTFPPGTMLLHYHQGKFLKDFPDAFEDAVMTALARLPHRKGTALLEFLDTQLTLDLSQTAGEADYSG